MMPPQSCIRNHVQSQRITRAVNGSNCVTHLESFCPGKLLFTLLTVSLLILILPFTAQADQQLSSGEQAWTFQYNRQSTEALALLLPEVDTKELSPREVYVLAHCLNSTEQSAVAESLFHTWLEKDPSAKGPVLGLASLSLNPADPVPADSLLDLALALYSTDTADDSTGQMIVHELKGLLRYRSGDCAAAAEHYETALALCELLPTPLARIHNQYQVARAWTSCGRTEEAAAILQLVITGADDFGLNDLKGNALIHLSVLARWISDLDSSLSYRHQALIAYERAENQVGQARALHYIAAIHLIRGDLTQAMKFLQRALATAEATGDRNAIASVHGDIGSLYYFIGDTERSVQEFTIAVTMGEGVSDLSWLAGISSNIGTILLDGGSYQEALTHLERSLADMHAAGNPRQETHVLSNIGRCLCEMGEYESGINRLTEAACSAHKWDVPVTEAFCLSYMAQCYLQSGQLEAAEEALYEAAALSTTGHIERVILLCRAKLAMARSNRDQALDLLEQAIAYNESIRSRSRGLSSVASSFLADEMPIYEEAVHLMWSLSTNSDQVDTPARSVIARQYDHSSFALAQRAKARSFLDMLAEAEVDLRPHSDPRYREREDQILSRINELISEQENLPAASPLDSPANTTGASPGDTTSEKTATATAVAPERTTRSIDLEIARFENDLIALEEELRDADPRYAELIYPRPNNLHEVQTDILQDGDLLLEFMLGDSASFVWAVTREEFRWVKLPPRANIESQVRALLPMIEDYNLLGDNPAYFIDPALTLTNTLLGSVQDMIAKARLTIVSPHGILHYLPFDILLADGVAPASTPRSFADLTFLIDSTTITYTPSISVLSRLRRDRDEITGEMEQRELLLIGDPEYQSAEDYSVFALKRSAGDPLIFAADEMTSIRNLFPADRVTIHAGPAANPGNLRRAGDGGYHRLIHIAAHGVYNETSPQYSGLLLSPDIASADSTIKLSEDGYLSAEEIFGLHLPCDQLVLSACSSALGEHFSGEGVTGLVRAFLYAGAASVVASLWDVDDQATAEFMAIFYQTMLADQSGSGAAALARTKRRMIHESELIRFSHPYFWAAFTLTGDI